MSRLVAVRASGRHDAWVLVHGHRFTSVTLGELYGPIVHQVAGVSGGHPVWKHISLGIVLDFISCLLSFVNERNALSCVQREVTVQTSCGKPMNETD